VSNAPIHILLVEDNSADAYLIVRFLAAETQVSLTHAERLDDAINRLQNNHFAAILLDLSLPDSRGIETVKQMHAADPELPIIILTGLDDEEVAIAALREGAQDYLVKGDIQKSGLIRAIHYAIERQQTLDKLQHVNQELTRSNEELERFAYVVSHDLQQPLQGILGFAQLLTLTQQEQLNDTAKDYLEHIVSTGKRMSQLIQDLLNYSRVGADEQVNAPTDCHQLVQEVLSEIGPTLAENQGTVGIEPLPTLWGKASQLKQLFQNLLSNALKYHSPGQAPQVSVSAELQATDWRFAVQDNGIGIEPAHFDQIFQIFQRLHGSQDYPGTGIGLATCKKIVENHGGRIWVESEPGVGTSVYFTLPAAEPRPLTQDCPSAEKSAANAAT
jgi:two-component system, sensor histidine kinase and response regulator